MFTRNDWNTIIVTVIITAIIWGFVGSIIAYTYSFYYRVIDIQSQMYLSIEAENINDKQFIDYLTDPINFRFINWITPNENILSYQFKRFDTLIEETITPWKSSPYLMIWYDLETTFSINRVKKIMIYYKKSWEENTWNIKLNFIRYSKNYAWNFQGGIIQLPLDSAQCLPSVKLSYSCEYKLEDFWWSLKWNIYDYLLFFSSNNGISFAMEGLDENDIVVNLPLRYIHQNLSYSSKWWKINKKLSRKIDLHNRFNVNINRSLYSLP